MFSSNINEPAALNLGTSLELQPSNAFELQLLELALKGQNVYKARMDKMSVNYDINKRKMRDKILREIEMYEKDGNIKLLENRARELTVRTKSTSLHPQAMIVYLKFLDLGSSPRHSLDLTSLQIHQREGIEPNCNGAITNNHLLHYTLEEKLEQLTGSPSLNAESLTLPKDSCTQKPQGEPSADESTSSLELLSVEGQKYDWLPETNEGRRSSQVWPRRKLKISCQINQIPGKIDVTSTPVPSTTDENFERMLSIPLPSTREEDSSWTGPKETDTLKVHGEPSSMDQISTTDLISSELLAIFDRPTGTDEGFIINNGRLSLDIADPQLSQENLPILTNIQDGINHGSLCRWQGKGFIDNGDTKKELAETERQLPVVLGNFPGDDFQEQVEWNVDGTIFKAKNIADLRSKHHVLIQGVFRKRCRMNRWRDYYGFFLCTGIMIYFRNEVFKKVADFRKCTVTIAKTKAFRLIVEDVYVDTEHTYWPLEFSNAINLNIWYKTIARFSSGVKPDSHESPLTLD